MNEQEHKEIIMTQVQSAVAPLATIVHEVKDILDTHTKQEADRIEKLEESHNRHLEIYANNGYESKRVADNLSVMLEDLKIMHVDSKERSAKVDEMYKKFNEDRIVDAADKKRLQTIITYGGVAGAIVAIGALLRVILK